MQIMRQVCSMRHLLCLLLDTAQIAHWFTQFFETLLETAFRAPISLTTMCKRCQQEGVAKRYCLNYSDECQRRWGLTGPRLRLILEQWSPSYARAYVGGTYSKA